MAVALTTDVQTCSQSLSSFTTSSDSVEDSKTHETNSSSPREGAGCCSDYESGNNSTCVFSGSSSIQDSDSDSDDDEALPAYWWLLPNHQQFEAKLQQQQQQVAEWQQAEDGAWTSRSWSAGSDHSCQEPSTSQEFSYGELPKLPKTHYLSPIQRRKLSCLLSKILRHAAHSWGLHITADGFVAVQELLNIPAFWEDGCCLKDIQFVMQWEEQEGEKQRFAMRQGPYGPEIRANQGHSQEAVDGQLVSRPAKRSELPTSVLHGTYCRNLTSILADGLKPMRRHHIHMFIEETCVGRRDAEVLIHVDVAKALAVGVEFLLSENGVVLTTGACGRIPPACFGKIIRVDDGAVLEEFGDHASFVVPSTNRKANECAPKKVHVAAEASKSNSRRNPRRSQGKTGWANTNQSWRSW